MIAMANKKKLVEKKEQSIKKHFGVKFWIALIVILVFYFVLLGLQMFRENRMLREAAINKYPVVLKNYPETGNWKTYKNDIWTFKYPKDWLVVDCGSKVSLLMGPQLENGQKIDCKDEYPHPNKAIYVFRGKAVDETNGFGKDPENKRMGSFEKIIIDAKEAWLDTSIYNGMLLQQSIFVKFGEYVDHINLWEKEHKETYDKIISTFRYL